jgi:TolA-binding protein
MMLLQSNLILTFSVDASKIELSKTDDLDDEETRKMKENIRKLEAEIRQMEELEQKQIQKRAV